MESLPKMAVILVALWVPLALGRNATTPATLQNETVLPVQSQPPATPTASPTTTTEPPRTPGSWFFWRRSVDGNDTVPQAGNFTTAGPVLNMSTNVTGTPVAEALATRSVDGPTTVELTSMFTTAASSASTPSPPAEPKAHLVEAVSNHSGSGNVTAEPTSATFTDTLRDRSGTTPGNAAPSATEPTTNVQSFNVGSTTEVSATSSTLRDVAATSDASCHCHDAVVPSTSAQSAAVQQQAYVTHPSAHGASATGVTPAPTGRRPVREPQTTTTAPADYFTPPDYII